MAKKQSKILRVKLVKSGIGYSVRTKRTLKALGFHNLNQVVEHEDNDALRGMLTKVSHLIEILPDTEEK
jgi:large subunit ribosomal protein L30